MKRLWIVLILVGMLGAVAACQASGPETTGQQAPRPDDSFYVLNSYKDSSGRFKMDVPLKWNVQPQRLAQDNMKVATAFVGPDGFASVTQFDFGKVPGEPADQLLDAFLQVTGVTQNKDYKQLARLPVSPSQVMIEMEYTNNQGRALHSLGQLRVDGQVISLVSINFNQDVWPRAVTAAKQMLDSYTFTDNKGG
ncbi:MAG: hypothetical protein U0822_05135 [Anaerolineae bacterium]